MKNVPFNFARSVLRLSLGDIIWGCRNSIIEWCDAVTFAMHELNGESDPLLVELAILDKSEVVEIKELAMKIHDDNPTKRDISKRNWLIISLSWAYHERKKYSDPLGSVEEIYADFDYPSEIAPIVRYMPPVDGYDPSMHSFKENEERLMEKWRKIIEV